MKCLQTFFFKTIVLDNGNKNIYCHLQQKRPKHAITACQEHNKVTFINIYTCTQPRIGTTNTADTHQHGDILRDCQTPYFKMTLIYVFIYLDVKRCGALLKP